MALHQQKCMKREIFEGAGLVGNAYSTGKIMALVARWAHTHLHIPAAARPPKCAVVRTHLGHALEKVRPLIEIPIRTGKRMPGQPALAAA